MVRAGSSAPAPLIALEEDTTLQAIMTEAFNDLFTKRGKPPVGPLPLSFLRGVGLPDNFIEYLPSLLNQPIAVPSDACC
jgi:hypothetical protein